MSEEPDFSAINPPGDQPRCPHCDSVVAAESDRCLMCGATLELTGVEPAAAEPSTDDTIVPKSLTRAEREPQAETPVPEVAIEPQQASDEPGFVESAVEERPSRVLFWMTGVVFVMTALLGTLVVRHSGPVQLALMPTPTPLAPTASFTPSVTLPPTQTSAPTGTPTLTPEPSPSPTPQPPRVHNVTEGETLFGLSLFYNVAMDVIAEMNGFSVDTPIQSGQTLEVPWPTATPPLEPIRFEVNGEPLIADPTNCERYEIQEGDAISAIAARNNIDFNLLLRVNRLDDQSIMQPGDTICIPEIIHGDVLPPTPGPSPTPSPTSFPPGPTLLYPIDGTVVEMEQEPIILQWVAVKDLPENEWYMVELTDLAVEGQHPQRAFTRDNAFRVPQEWRPPVDEYHDFRWRVSIVRVTGQRQDGEFIYTFGGRNSEDGYFTWKGAVPTPTPTATVTPTPEP
ncbi:MAG TPA: LysM peptidoglycan-binding domain-containing protein [Candidatus Sulfomarinibacteraceae bacterium]|nr:LysM peptidoglycan-binding domain-containing protein [Candidatus Sulfomarinibacteraceae bacterium]